MVDLASAPGCTERYHGAYLRGSVIIVGRLTPSETLYRKPDRDAAAKHARDANLTYDHVLATELCHDVVMGLFGA
jgi:hypothetical protein